MSNRFRPQAGKNKNKDPPPKKKQTHLQYLLQQYVRQDYDVLIYTQRPFNMPKNGK